MAHLRIGRGGLLSAYVRLLVDDTERVACRDRAVHGGSAGRV